MKDVIVNQHATAITQCTASCNGVGPTCVAVRLHGTDEHCHGLLGAAPTHDAFMTHSNATAASARYQSCLLVKKP